MDNVWSDSKLRSYSPLHCPRKRCIKEVSTFSLNSIFRNVLPVNGRSKRICSIRARSPREGSEVRRASWIQIAGGDGLCYQPRFFSVNSHGTLRWHPSRGCCSPAAVDGSAPHAAPRPRPQPVTNPRGHPRNPGEPRERGKERSHRR